MKIEGFGSVKFWMSRLSDEHLNKAKKEIEKSSTYFFQVINFDRMRDEVKETVLKELLEDIKIQFGEEEHNRIKEEYFGKDKVEEKSK